MAPYTSGIIGPLILANYSVQALFAILILVFPSSRRSTTARQRRWIVVGLVSGLLLGSGFSILRHRTDGAVPSVMGLAYLVFAAIVYAGMIRRRFFVTSSRAIWQRSLAVVADGIFLTDEEHRIVELNEAAAALLNTDYDDLIGKDLRRFIRLEESESDNPELTWIGGAERYISVTESVQRDRGGHAVVRVFVVRDVTREREQAYKLKRSVDHQHRLLQEVHHRVKNSLQIIDSIVGLKAREVAAGREGSAVSEIGLRIRVMASIYNRAYDEPEVRKVSVFDCLTQIAKHYRTRSDVHVLLTRETPDVDVFVEVEAAIPLSLAAAELVSLAVSATISGAESDNRVAVTLCPAGNRKWMIRISAPGAHPFDVEQSSGGIAVAKLLCQQVEGYLEADPSELMLRFPVEPQSRTNARPQP
jgi:PAS domain S-box-containing protein